MANKYPGIDNINKPAFDAIVPRTKEGIESGEIPKETTLYKCIITLEKKDGVTLAEGCSEKLVITCISNKKLSVSTAAWMARIQQIINECFSIRASTTGAAYFVNSLYPTAGGPSAKLVCEYQDPTTFNGNPHTVTLDTTGKYNQTVTYEKL